jgi:hypothetical protein
VGAYKAGAFVLLFDFINNNTTFKKGKQSINENN